MAAQIPDADGRSQAQRDDEQVARNEAVLVV